MRPSIPAPAIASEDDLSPLLLRRDRLQQALARASVDPASLDSYRSNEKQEHLRFRTWWRLALLRFFAGGVVGTGVAFLIAWAIIYGTFRWT